MAGDRAGARADYAARIDFAALAQWAGTGAVQRRARAPGHQRRYRLGRWHSRSASSWNPPGAAEPAAGGSGSGGGRSALSVDISRKPSESRRSSILSVHSPRSDASASASDDEGGPLAQMLLRENDEIWNNPAYRFTFYSPATGTVRSDSVQTLCTDSADGLDALMRQALAAAAAAAAPADDSDDSDRAPGAHGAMPQLSVTSADAGPHQAAETLSPPDGLLLHPNYTRSGRRSPPQPAPAPVPAPAPPPPQRPPRPDSAPESPGLFWLDMTDPTDAEVLALSQVFGLHPLTTDELLLLQTQPLAQDSFKSFRNYDIVCYRTSQPAAAAAPAPAARRPSLPASDSSAEKDAARDKPLPGGPDDAAAPRRSWRQRLAAALARPRHDGASDPDVALPDPDAAVGDSADGLEEPMAFYMIVLPQGVVTVHCGNVPHVRNTIARLKMDEELVRLSPDYIAYLLLDDITDTLVPTTRLLELEVDAIDELVLILTRAEHDDVLKRIGIERRHALWLVRLLHGKAEVLRAVERRVQAKSAGIARVSKPADRHGDTSGGSDRHSDDDDNDDDDDDDDDGQPSQLLTSDEEEGDLYGPARIGRTQPQPNPRFKHHRQCHHHHHHHHHQQQQQQQQKPDVTKYLADVHDHLVSLTASVHHCERILARAHGNYLARINLELTHASNTTNQLATQMTVLAGVFLPMNLVAGLFGMNVKVPGRDRDDLRDFGLIVGSMALFVVITLAVCRWRRII
ncbi:CorA metal ion transporter [Coemansia javaensis]|uniref:CorA metal ion transporter n=1 Tax=Coemansia javaensis TaxID=2761396 RepID=A0A9W8H653_9FUNG|nr:CorA metal ion transporter [Coemansia javaensis]